MAGTGVLLVYGSSGEHYHPVFPILLLFAQLLLVPGECFCNAMITFTLPEDSS